MDERAGRAAITLVAAALAATTAADEVVLRSGGRLDGVVVERTRDRVVVEMGPGRVTMPASQVERIVEGRSALEEFRERAGVLEPGDTEGWEALARWAADHDLQTQSREAWRRVLAGDSSHPEANTALGRVQVNGAWMGSDEAYRARGYVQIDGRWVTPTEHEALLRERAFEHQARLEREAEARAREAEDEARAREARAAAEAARESGIPLWWGGDSYWGSGTYLGVGGYWGTDGTSGSNGHRRSDGHRGAGGHGQQRSAAGGHRNAGVSWSGGAGDPPAPAPRPTTRPGHPAGAVKAAPYPSPRDAR